MKELNRTKVGKFTIEQSITLDELEKNCDIEENIENHMITMEKLLENNPKIVLNKKQL